MGIHEPRAQPKRAVVGARPRSAVEMAAQGQRCPLKGDPMSDAPSGWRYDPTLWAPLIDTYLAPWAAGNLSATGACHRSAIRVPSECHQSAIRVPSECHQSAIRVPSDPEGPSRRTVLDMAYWPQMYGTTRAHALPGVHAAVKDGYLFVRSQNDYRLELFLDMMKTVSGLVRLPNAEFVACLYDHAKVDRQTPLPVFVHYSDVAHRDVPIPAPWSWDETQHAFPQPWVKVRAGCATPWSQRDSVLYFRGGCNGPTRGWRGESLHVIACDRYRAPLIACDCFPHQGRCGSSILASARISSRPPTRARSTRACMTTATRPSSPRLNGAGTRPWSER